MRELFLRDDADVVRYDELALAYQAQLDDAEEVLDGIAQDACREARGAAKDPSR